MPAKLNVQAVKNGEVVREFPTMTEAASWSWAQLSAIHACCNGTVATAKGYSWRFSDPSKRKTFVAKDGHKKSVVKMKDGKVVGEYDSITAAGASVGISDISNVAKCCRTASGMAHGYVWRFAGEENAGASKKIVMSKDGVAVKEFGSPAEAAQYLGLPKSTLVSKCLNGKCSLVLGHSFSYAE